MKKSVAVSPVAAAGERRNQLQEEFAAFPARIHEAERKALAAKESAIPEAIKAVKELRGEQKRFEIALYRAEADYLQAETEAAQRLVDELEPKAEKARQGAIEANEALRAAQETFDSAQHELRVITGQLQAAIQARDNYVNAHARHCADNQPSLGPNLGAAA